MLPVRRALALALPALLATSLLAVVPAANAVNPPHGAIVSADPANFTPNITNGRVNALTVVGNRVVVGGTFSTVQNAGSSTNLTRNYLFSFDATTGVVDPNFRPSLNKAVEALAPGPDGTSVYVGGRHTTINGSSNFDRLSRLRLSDGQLVTSFAPNPNGNVYDLVSRNGRLYAGGEFTTIGGQARTRLAALDLTTGAADATLNIPFSGNPIGGASQVWKFDITPNGSTMVVTGNFDTAGGQPRSQIAIVDLSTSPATLSSWSTDLFPFYDTSVVPPRTWCAGVFPHWIREIDISPDGTYVAVVTTGGNNPNRLCDSLTRWELGRTGPGQTPTWTASTGGDSFHSVLATGTAIYAGGHQQWVNNPYNPSRCGVCTGPFPGGMVRTGFSAHDPLNGLPFRWNPGRNPRGKGVLAMVATPTGFFFGSNTDRIAGEYRRKLAFMPLAGGTTVPSIAMPTLPGGFFSVAPTGASTTMVRRSYNGTTFGAPGTVATGVDWSDTRGAFALNGRLYQARSNGTLTVRSFNGTTAGNATAIDLHGLQTAPDPVVYRIPGTALPIPGLGTHLSAMTGLAYEGGWLYYTVQGDPRLYSRGFTEESQTVGAPLLVASSGDGVDWANVRGLAIASGNLYFALADGTLNRIAWVSGHPTGGVTTIGGPAIDGTNWASGGLFVFGS